MVGIRQLVLVRLNNFNAIGFNTIGLNIIRLNIISLNTISFKTNQITKYLQCAVISLFLFVGGCANADTASEKRAAELETLYEISGVDIHLSLLHDTVKSEAKVAWQACENQSDQNDLEGALQKLLSIQSLRDSFMVEMNEQINDSQLSEISGFMGSEVGQQLVAAEIASKELNDEKFTMALNELKESDGLNDERVTAIKMMLEGTGAAYFLSALNTELSNLVRMASLCSNSVEEIELVVVANEKDRIDETFYRSFMRQELLASALVVYRDLPTKNINAISEFAKTDAGNSYYAALIQGMRAVLSGKSEALQVILEKLPD